MSPTKEKCCVKDVVAWINDCEDPEALRLVAKTAASRLDHLSHQDAMGAGVGMAGAGYKALGVDDPKQK